MKLPRCVSALSFAQMASILSLWTAPFLLNAQDYTEYWPLVSCASPRINPSGKEVVVGFDRANAGIWDVAKKTFVEKFHGKEKSHLLKGAGFVNDCKGVWLAYSDGSIAVIEREKRQNTKFIDCGRQIYSAVVDPTCSTVLFVGRENALCYKLDVATNKVNRLEKVLSPDVIEFRSEKRVFAIAGIFSAAAWKFGDDKRDWLMEHNSTPLALTPDGKSMLFFDVDSAGMSLNIRDGKSSKITWSMAADEPVVSAHISDDGKLIFFGDDEGRLTAIKAADRKKLDSWKLDKQPIISIDMDKESKTACVQAASGRVYVVASGRSDFDSVPITNPSSKP